MSANQVGRIGKVIGIDITDKTLEKARKKAKDNEDDNFLGLLPRTYLLSLRWKLY